MQKSKIPQIVVRFPPELKQWLVAKAQANFSSQNVEIIRSVRERRERDGCKPAGSNS